MQNSELDKLKPQIMLSMSDLATADRLQRAIRDRDSAALESFRGKGLKGLEDSTLDLLLAHCYYMRIIDRHKWVLREVAARFSGDGGQRAEAEGLGQHSLPEAWVAFFERLWLEQHR